MCYAQAYSHQCSVKCIDVAYTSVNAHIHVLANRNAKLCRAIRKLKQTEKVHDCCTSAKAKIRFLLGTSAEADPLPSNLQTSSRNVSQRRDLSQLNIDGYPMIYCHIFSDHLPPKLHLKACQ